MLFNIVLLPLLFDGSLCGAGNYSTLMWTLLSRSLRGRFRVSRQTSPGHTSPLVPNPLERVWLVVGRLDGRGRRNLRCGLMAAQHNRIPSHEEFDLGSDVPAHHSQESLIEDNPSGVAVLGDGFYQRHVVITVFTHCIYDEKAREVFPKLIISTDWLLDGPFGEADLSPRIRMRTR